MSLNNVKPTSFLNTIRFRLTVGYICVLLITIIAISFYFYHSLKFALLHDVTLFMENEFAHSAAYIAKNLDQRNLIIHELNDRVERSAGQFELYYALFDLNGNILAKSHNFAEDLAVVDRLKNVRDDSEESTLEAPKTLVEGTALPTPQTLATYVKSYKDTEVRLLTRPIFREGKMIYFLQLGVNITGVENVLSKYRITLVLAIPVVLMLAGLGGYLLAWHYLKPITHITKAAQKITVSNAFEAPLPLTGSGDELDHLAETFNDVFKKLSESYRKIVQFSADASHELRIPITTLKGEAEVILDRERDLEEYRRVLESSIEEYDRLSKMLNDLLILSRSDLGQGEIEFENVDLSQLIAQMADFLQPVARAKELILQCVPEENIMVQGNKIMLERLFINILDNAIKYTPARKHIAITLQSANDVVRVSIKDQGIGIPADKVSQVFDRFYRIDTSRSREQGGSGLGLSIAKMIADAHKGTIDIRSEEGKGTEVIITLPVK